MPAILDIPPNHFLPHPFRPSAPSSTSRQRLIDRVELSRRQAEVSRRPAGSDTAEDMARIGVAVAPSLPHHYAGYSHPRPDVQIGVERRNVTTTTNASCSREETTQQQQQQRLPRSLISQHSNINQESSTSPVKSTASSVSSPPLSSSMGVIGGNLAEFAAQVACLFWFAKASKLKLIEESSPSYTPTSPLELEFAPNLDFKKWVTGVLTTTQVSKNVVLLALLFIYRLKKFNPAVRGKRGSEFRLMTIALMMGNKFLDDNTYTNKTWAEVSGISVQEIHVMEVEFLSNVRYNLFVTKEEWDQWRAKLSVFSAYFEKTSRLTLDVYSANRSAHASPAHSPLSPSMDSYRAPQQAAQMVYPTTTHAFNSNQTPLSLNIPQTNGLSFGFNDPTLRPALPIEPLSAHRKRSWDEQANENPAKRPATATTTWVRPPTQATTQLYQPPQLPSTAPLASQTQVPTSMTSMPSNMAPQLPRPLPAAYPINSASIPASAAPFTTAQPLSTTPRPTIFPTNNTPARWSQAPVSQPSLAPLPITNHQSGMSNGFSDPSRRAGPGAFSAATSATTISPAISAYSVRTPIHLSPSSILLDRNSPYRPVRAVNTLLYPPPSGSLLQPRQLSVDLMRYQPLGKRSSEDRVDRTGVLPYSQPNIWGQQYLARVQPTTQAAPYHQG
ncbi:hypothetical protein FQN49_001443 [Arthroderma sp. PD_2]|nr:hypothetical protein FQN49_001443 [Arthroderma sp. PD_2]